MFNSTDVHYMRSAINMARRGAGKTAPNPSVGCVIVKNDIVISRARTADGGVPHAEKIALDKVGAQAKGATLYVTLEPCAHHGKTSPCVDAIIDSGVKRVVIGMIDVDPRVSGKSIEKLTNAGIEVVYGVLENECHEAHAGFISRVNNNRPYITMKTACTIDGKIALASGESKWITGELARRHVHKIRAQNDAVLIGVNTAIADDPMLDVRLDGLEGYSPKRIVLDSDLRIDINSKLVRSANKTPLIIFSNVGEVHNKFKILQDLGVVLHQIDPKNIISVLDIVSGIGVNNLLIEGGASVHSAFLQAGFCDELMIYRAPTLLGMNAKSSFNDLGVDDLAQRYDFNLYYTLNLGGDVLEVYNNKNKV